MSVAATEQGQDAMRRGRKKISNPATARRILAAAESHFAAQGLAGARTDDIAEAAHANKAMLYYYFKDKKQLHRAVLENLFRQLQALIDNLAHSHASPSKTLASFMSEYFDFLASHPNYPRLVQREAMESSGEFQRIFREYFQPFQRQLARVIEAGVKSGEFRRVDAHHAVFSLIGMTNFYFVAAWRFGPLFGDDPLSPRALAERKEALMDLLMHGLSPCEVRPR
jgi:TetR/AcrR family transcriptional regulator